MDCPKCGRYLGEGMLPARCPHCGANLANPTDAIRGSKATASRRNVEGLTGIGKGNTSGRRRHYLQVLLAIVLVGAFGALFWFALRGFGASDAPIVPDVVGWRVERATEELVGAGYGVVVEVTYDETQMDGIVLGQEPAGGVEAKAGTQVRVTVATSKVMPTVVGLTQEEAESALREVGIPFSVHEEISDRDEGIVIEASVQPGVALGASDGVELTVARKPRVPQLVGLAESDAIARIEAQQLVAESVLVADPDAPQATVVAQDPAEGEALSPGSKVTIKVATTEEGLLESAANAVLQAIYDIDPANDAVGSALKPLLSSDNPYADAEPHEIWWNVVKRGGRFDEQPDELQSLPRSLEKSELKIDPENRTVTATITVDWDWTGLPGASAAGSEDTRTVTMKFDDEGKLLSLTDDQTDVPFFTTSS